MNISEDLGTSIEESRTRKPRRSFSPSLDEHHGSTKTNNHLKKDSNSIVEESSDNFNWHENDQTVKCDKCHSPYAIDPAKRKRIVGKKVQKPKFRKRLDPVTNKILTLCNKCGLSMSRVRKRPPRKPLPTLEDKNGYLMEAEAFASSLSERLNEPDAKRLYCPHFNTEPCGCLQKYLKGNDDEDPSKVDEKAIRLIELLKRAKHLSTEKMHSNKSVPVSGAKAENEEHHESRGVGNRHSEIFENFVLSHRVSLREELHLCEKATQRVLMYSNNFLHKELKGMKKQRIERKTGKFVRGLLKPIPDLPLVTCCNDKCVKLAASDPELLEFWRKIAQRGQQEARRVLAEMLTHKGASKTTCYKFISLVTGCSLGTISSVSNHMRKTCGSKEPPEHGLKRWWRENPKRRKTSSSDNKRKNEENNDSTEGEAIDSDSPSLQIASKTTCDSAVSSKDIPLKPISQKQDPPDQQMKMKRQKTEVQHQQVIVNDQLRPKNVPGVISGTTPPHTIQQLLLSPDIGAVTVLAVPKSPSDPIQMTSAEEMAKEEIMIPEGIESNRGINAENLSRMIQVCQPSSSGNPHLLGEKDLSKLTSDSSVLRSDSNRVLNVHAETVPSRRHLGVLEVPLSDSSSQTSVITSLAEKSHPQTSSVVSPSSHVELVANGVPWLVPCVQSVVLLPGTIVLDPSIIGPSCVVYCTDTSL